MLLCKYYAFVKKIVIGSKQTSVWYSYMFSIWILFHIAIDFWILPQNARRRRTYLWFILIVIPGTRTSWDSLAWPCFLPGFALSFSINRLANKRWRILDSDDNLSINTCSIRYSSLFKVGRAVQYFFDRVIHSFLLLRQYACRKFPIDLIKAFKWLAAWYLWDKIFSIHNIWTCFCGIYVLFFV